MRRCEQAEAFVRRRSRARPRAPGGAVSSRRRRPLREPAREALAAAGERESGAAAEQERKRHERELLEARRRSERRARTRTLDLSLRLAELWLRDLMCVCEGAPELVYAVDRRPRSNPTPQGPRSGARLREGLELVADTRLSLPLNVSEELALEALSLPAGSDAGGLTART